jgi:hypothetical protein
MRKRVGLYVENELGWVECGVMRWDAVGCDLMGGTAARNQGTIGT